MPVLWGLARRPIRPEVSRTAAETVWSVSPPNWSHGERVLAGATVCIFLALPVPWWFYGPFRIDGFHDWGWFTFVG